MQLHRGKITFIIMLAAGLLTMAAAPPLHATPANNACAPLTLVRVAGPIKDDIRTTLSGNVHPLARAQYDQGRVSDSLPLEHIIMMLRRTFEQETAMQTRIDQMHNRRSPLFHQWLSAEQVGGCYGVHPDDIAAVTGWLQLQGFHVDSVPAGSMFIVFSGTAGQVRQAFHTEIHNLMVNGERHIANMSQPSVPSALAPVIAGFRSLHNFFPKPTMKMVGITKRDPTTGRRYLVKDESGIPSLAKFRAKKPGPLITYADTGEEWVGPQDFYTIYNESPLLSGTLCAGSPCNGAGETIGVIEETDVCAGQSGTTPDDCNGANDLATWESQFGLPTATVNYLFGITAGGYCADPGVQGPNGSGEESEADIDLQWASSVAPGATVDFIACASTGTTAGVDLSAMYAISNLSASLSSFSLSYGLCEAVLPVDGFGANSFYNALWEQAVAQGQTVSVSAGDSGDDTCDRGATDGTSGTSVNGLASTPFNVAAGGTDFSDNYSNDFAVPPTVYWNANQTSPYGSALSYVPEMTWNETCGSTLVTSLIGVIDTGNPSNYTPEQICNGASPTFGEAFTYVNASGGGGISSIYSLPTWQSVYGLGLATNYTSAAMRNLPDLSLFAAANLWNHALQFCESDVEDGIGGDFACDYSTDNGESLGAGGTSFVAPQIAGLMALINQAYPSGNPAQPTRQGQANYSLYSIATYEYGTVSTENTSTDSASTVTCESNADAIATYALAFPTCVFYNINRTPLLGNTDPTDCSGNDNTSCLQDGNIMPCGTGTTDCYTATSGDMYGLYSTSTSAFQPAWYQSAGFSDAVGLGSVNITNLVSNWSALTVPFGSSTVASAMPAEIPPPASDTTTLMATVTATGRGSLAPPLGTVTFYSGSTCRGAALGTAPLVPATGCTTSCNSTASLPGISGTQLGGTGVQRATACFSGDGANDAPSFGTTTVAVGGTTLTLTASANPSTWGQNVTFTASITPVGTPGPTGTVEFQADGADITGCGAISVASGSATCSTSLLVTGTHSITASYSGDSNYLASMSMLSQTVNPAVLTVTANNATTTFGAPPPVFTASYTGFQNGDGVGVLSGSPSLTVSCGVINVSHRRGAGPLQTCVLTVGSYTIVAAQGSLMAQNYTFTFVNGTLTVTPAATALSLTSGANPSVAGQSVTFTAALSPIASPAATGTVDFQANGTDISGCGAVSPAADVAQCTTSSLASGSNTITANYSGDSNYSSASGSLTQTVNASGTGVTPVLEVTTSPGPLSIQAGQSATMTVNVAVSPSGQSVGPVALTCAVAPAGPTCTLSSDTLASLPGAVTATISTTGSIFLSRMHGSASMFALLLPGLLLLPAGSRRLRRRMLWLAAAMLLLLSLSVLGCGGSSSSSGANSATYAVTVSGSASGAVSSSATFAVNVHN